MALPIRISLKDDFFKEEVKCGYVVTEHLKKIWAVELDLLNELLMVCQENDIRVQVFGGTLLGAVRHKGFIPWDDDLDVAMTRKDFNRLCMIAPTAFKHPYFFQTAASDRKRFIYFGRLRNTMTTAVITGHETADYNNGIYIDVYVLEGYAPCRWLTAIQDLIIKCTLKPLTMYYRDSPKNSSLRERIARLTRPFFRMFSYDFLLKLNQWATGFFTPFVNRIGLRDEMSEPARRYWMTKDECRNTVFIPFENLLVPASANWDVVLTRLYGNYKEYPAKTVRGRWHEGQISFNPEKPYIEYFKELK